MQTRTYGDLFSLISNMIGAVELAADEQTQIKNFINRRFQEAFDTSPVWPRYLVSSEERDIISIIISGLTAGSSSDSSGLINGNYVLFGTASGTEAVVGTKVYYNAATGTEAADGVSGATVLFKSSSNNRWELHTDSEITLSASGIIDVESGAGDAMLTEVIPSGASSVDNPSDVVTWTIVETPKLGGTPLFQDKQLIPYAETNRTTIGDFNRIHRKKAFLNNSAIEYDFFADADGANILNIISTTDNTAFVTYKKQFTPFSVTTDFYNSTAEVPAEFFNYIAHTVYADFLRVQNKQEEAIAEENVGAKYLAQELEKVDIRMNNSTINKRFSTYVSRQSR